MLLESGLDAIGCVDWLKGLILDGIVAGVGAVLGFVPQMLVLFIFLAFLESCGYMARIAFIMDRISVSSVFQVSHSFQCLSVQVVVFLVSWLHVQLRTTETVR